MTRVIEGGAKGERWVKVAVAPDQLTAEMWQQRLSAEGIPSIIRASDAVSFMGVSSMPCRILVPDGYAREARAVLGEMR